MNALISEGFETVAPSEADALLRASPVAALQPANSTSGPAFASSSLPMARRPKR